MDKIKIIGGNSLHGKIYISGAKNAALPLICASLLTSDSVTIKNVPQLSDITFLNGLLKYLGMSISEKQEVFEQHQSTTYTYQANQITELTAPYDFVRKMRASYYVLGPLLARFKHAELSLPGGCAIGARPIDIHLSSLSHISDLFYPQKYGVKIRIVHSHSSSISANPLHYLLHYISKPFVRSLATNYLGCSDKALDWMYKYTGVRGEALMIKNGIDAERFRYNMQQREALRERMGLTNMSIIGHVGRFMKVKNHAFLLSVFAYFHEFHPDSKLMLVGDGDLLDSIKALAVQLGISGDVLFLGKRTDIPDLLQVMDIVVMPSLFEGLPVSLVEAQASGLPVLATNIISSDTMISSGFHSMSLSQGPEAWAAKIDNILASYQRIDTYGDIKNKGFDISDTVAILENIYMGIK